MSTVLDRRRARQQPVDRLSLRKVHHVETDVLPEADECVPLPAIDGVRKNPALTDIGDLLEQLLRLGIKNPKRRSGAEIETLTAQAHDAVVCARPGADPTQLLSGGSIDHEHPSVVRLLPPP